MRKPAPSSIVTLERAELDHFLTVMGGDLKGLRDRIFKLAYEITVIDLMVADMHKRINSEHAEAGKAGEKGANPVRIFDWKRKAQQ